MAGLLKFIEVLKLVAALMPAVFQIVKAVEDALPAAGQGKAKLEMVRTFLEQAFASAGQIGVAFEDAWPTLEKAVSAVVALFNKTTWKNG